MFRRYPYWGWLLLSLALWCITGYDFRMHRQALLPDRMAHEVNNDLKHREEAFEGFTKNTDIIRRIFSDSLSQKESYWIISQPFYVFAYQNDSLKLWNTNTVIAQSRDSTTKPVIIRNEKGIFIEECINPFAGDTGKKLVILFPVVITYPLENEYLKSHFAASAYIPIKTKIIGLNEFTKDDYPVTFKGESPVFYLHFNYPDIEKWTPDTPLFILLILALMASMSWIQLMTIYHTRKDSSLAGFIITVEIIFILRWPLYAYGLPFNLDTLAFFSPLLYASNNYLSSLGDLCINTFCVLWIIVFITRHTTYKTYFEKVKGKWTRFFIAILLIFGLVAYVFLFVNIIRSLVRDSNISFDVGHFYTINIYTIIGLFIIGTITGLSCLIIYLFNIQLRSIIKNKLVKYLLIVIIGISFMFITKSNHDGFYWALIGWLLVFTAVLDIRNFSLVSDLFEPHMILWALFICIFCTILMEYFTTEKEHISRIAFAQQKFTPDREYFLESAFDKTAHKIEQDKKIKAFFNKPSLSARKTEDRYFDSLYLTGAVNKYDLKVYFFDAKKAPLFNKDINSFANLGYEINESSTTNSPNLFYNESILERHYYLSYIEIYNDSINKITGYIIINMDQKKKVSGTVYPELLQPETNRPDAETNEYAYATYVNGKLIKQTNDNYPFTTYLKDIPTGKQQFKFFNKDNITELHYNIGEKRTIVVVHIQSQLIESITLFSYIFGMLVTLALIIFLYQLYLSYFSGTLSTGKFIRLTLRKRVHFAMLAVVLVSFLVIGSVTIWFFSDQYKQSNESKLQSTMVSAKLGVQEYLKQGNGYYSEYAFDSISKSAKFREFLANFASGQKTDINIFNNKGELINASQDEIYNKGLISRQIRPDAFYQLNATGKSVVIQNENVAGLSYLSAYEPLRDENGAALGYINVPFFSSEKNLNFQISNIVITLINLYAFIFLLSSLITVLISRWITRTFNIIIQQFGRLNLQRNERIAWPYDDEIGLLVSEYNKMVNKVEENAAKLAQSERERAWREMARQVAHEIKNPLTPMKLNIQFLQQAMKNDNPNIKELTNKVADSIVEQINNLSYIASEFSNFAKMPEAKAEELELGDLLHKAVELYLNNHRIKVTINQNTKGLLVLCDHSQLLRVFTNLLENAMQAIPEEREGNIDVLVTTESEKALISVTDNGNGIAENIAENIFQPYFTTKSSGTGLGLAMTKKIIEFWKGQIWFETKEGIGTTFYITLPLIKKETS